MREFETYTSYDNLSRRLFRCRKFQIKEGLTVLVGANGAGKSTTLSMIRRNLNKNKIPVVTYDNFTEGGRDGTGSYLAHGDMERFATSMSSSEGENILISMGNFVENGLRKFIKTGIVKRHWFSMDEDEEIISNERWILLDAVDSGLSINNIIYLKDFLKSIISDAEQMGKEVYIVVSANTYELASNENCFDVWKRKYVTFESYDDYKKFILCSGERKEKLESEFYKKREREKEKE